MKQTVSADTLLDRMVPEPRKGCWLWTGRGGKGTYGKIRVEGVTCQAHRVSYELFVGPIPDGMFVCHKCDVRCCINPDHLFVGTAADNTRDMVAKGRNYRGERCFTAKLTEDDVRNIRYAAATGTTLMSLARKYGVTNGTIRLIRDRKSWKHVV